MQTVDEQRDFAARMKLPYRLISDAACALHVSLGLPTFVAGGRTFYRRLTLVAEEGVIVRVFDPVVAPAHNAVEVARWLEGPDA